MHDPSVSDTVRAAVDARPAGRIVGIAGVRARYSQAPAGVLAPQGIVDRADIRLQEWELV